jgi:CRP-like cAMP-binding protein
MRPPLRLAHAGNWGAQVLTCYGLMSRSRCECKVSSDQSVTGLPSGLQPLFFLKLTKAEQTTLLSTASHRRLLESSVVVQEGDPAERFFLLTSGHCRQFVLTKDGRKIPINSLLPGQVFGGATLLSSPAKYLASTQVLSEGCALTWDRKTIRRLASEFPLLLDNALTITVNEYVAPLLNAKVSLSSEDAQSRIVEGLVTLASEAGTKVTGGVEIPVGNEEIAAAANVTPFTVSRCISKWQREGVVEKKRGKIILRHRFWARRESS